ncbi:MAG TPA: hypothetical protein VL986_10940 [Terracidiphilus sp.]|nr:hypothetical protein [Terracidiphilus sp.]
MSILNSRDARTAANLLRPGLLLLVTLALAISANAVRAQAGLPDRTAALSGQSSGTPRQGMDDPGDGSGGYLDSMMGHRRATMLNNERHKAMVSDSEKLLKLATELNNEIAHSNTGSLTPEQLRKIAEIEKLAHNVRDKMTMTIVSPTQNYFPTYGPPFGIQ